MGTRITHKSIGHDPKEDYRWVTKVLEKEGKVFPKSEKELKKLLKDPQLHLVQLGRKDIYAVNKLKYKKTNFYLLEGNPVTYYFSIAYDVLGQKDETSLLLLDSLKKEKSDYKWDTSVAFSYIFKVGSIGIIFSFLALEAFINQCLPDYAKIEFEGKTVDKNIIQKYLSFEDKFKIIIPKVTNKDFIKDHPRKVEVLRKLKKIRDELTHLKENRKGQFVAYENIYNDILNIDLKKIVNTVKFYINYHKPKTIQNYKKIKNKKAKVLFKEAGEDAKGKFVKYYYEENI